MTNKSTKQTPRVRRTNAERSATTRGKLIEAAIDILYRRGYSAATTIEVAKQARVSRGAMLHQFPARVNMLLAVAQHIVEQQRKHRRDRLGGETGPKRFYAAAEVSWEVHSQPGAIALLEIILASRSDGDLRKGLAPFVKSWMDMRTNAATRMAADLGVPETQSFATLVAFQQAALRGLAIEAMFLHNTAQIDAARKMLTEYNALFAERLLRETRDTQTRAPTLLRSVGA
ncbi:MAG TPA: TetR/AcrR family transcriptional regulator [Steroidobacteraceae bacterium]|nr:TetR/AcrR family transcriptional regulator [Steroidobacteraceae bacterium]